MTVFSILHSWALPTLKSLETYDPKFTAVFDNLQTDSSLYFVNNIVSVIKSE